MEGLAILLIIGGIYFGPSLIAFGRSHHNFAAILVFNIVLGWTLIGWLLALVWSCTSPPPASQVQNAR